MSEEEVKTDGQKAGIEGENAEKLEAMKQDLLRAMAENENLRKRHAKDLEEMSKFALSKAMKELAVPFESLFSALSSEIPEALRENEFAKALVEGIMMVQKEFEKVFLKYGLRRIYPLGEKFDHNFHQAISQVEDASKESGTVLQVVQAGYELHGRVLNPALVVVVK